MVLSAGFFDKLSRNWLLAPLLALLTLISVYVFLFADNGYLAYGQSVKEKQRLEEEITLIQEEIGKLEQKLTELKDNEKALENFVREYLLYDTGAVSVIKFIDEENKQLKEAKKELDLSKFQRNFIIGGSLFLLLILIFSYKFLRRREDVD